MHSALFLAKLGFTIANQECIENQNQPTDDGKACRSSQIKAGSSSGYFGGIIVQWHVCISILRSNIWQHQLLDIGVIVCCHGYIIYSWLWRFVDCWTYDQNMSLTVNTTDITPHTEGSRVVMMLLIVISLAVLPSLLADALNTLRKRNGNMTKLLYGVLLIYLIS